MRDLTELPCGAAARERVVEVLEKQRWQATRSASRFVGRLVHLAVAAGVAAGALFPPAVLAAWQTNARVLLLSAYPTEGAKLLAAAASVTEVGVFNGRRFFAGTIAGKNVVMGLTGIGLVNADRTTRAVLAYLEDSDIRVKAIVFSGVAGSSYDIGDVIVPDHWTDDLEHSAPPYPPYSVNSSLYAIARRLPGNVALDPNLYVEDLACTGLRSELSTPIRVEDPELRVNPGDEGYSSDPYGGRPVPCFTPGGNLLGCAACGAPPGAPGFGSDPTPFLDPNFFLELFQSFAPGEGGSAVIQDMETAAVARIATEKQLPFIAFRGVSDGRGDPLMLPPIPYLQFVVYQQLAADNAAAATLAFLVAW
ncbi:MAG: 5'-methylthioadenosine/S-adenosylhomocysteine nucleosidase [Deltaproteobacteria bacterium]|nr:MAG: 5'-methylthioadenosine/S-adenosylhomocysteine nucleosidase [Deltaproteobacteria bacterium]